MAISIANQWPATFAAQDAEMILNPTAGRTLVAVIVSRVIDGSAPLLALGDVARNAWTLLADPIQFASIPHASAQLQVEVWACPAARYDGWVQLFTYASAMQITATDTGSVAVNVLEVPGLANQLAVDSVTPFTATNSTTLAMTAPAPTGGANVFQIAAAAGDIAYGSYTTTGTGWTQLNNVTNTNPEVGLFHAWREATTGGSVTFGLLGGAMRNWAGVIVALKTAGITPAQPNPAWPPTSFQVGLGYDLSTPLSRVRWTDQTSRYLSVSGQRGIQAELGTAQQGQASVSIRNDDGAYTPRPVAAAATATATGTTTTVKVADVSAANIHVTDFFRLKTSGGALKQLDVFQVTGLSSSGGTTTITFKRADGTAGGALAATATGDVYAGIAIDLYTPWRLVLTVAGTPYIVGSGWLKDAQIGFDGAHWSQVEGSSADAIEVLSAAANTSAFRGELYRHSNLYAYWPLDDSSKASAAANQSGTSNASLVETVSKYGSGANTVADFGAATQDLDQGVSGTTTSLFGDAGTGWALDGLTSAEMNAQKGYALVGNDPGFPSITNGVTIMGAFTVSLAQITTLGSSTTDPTLFILRNGDPGAGISAGSIIKLSYSHSLFTPIVTVWDKDTHAASSTSLTSSPQLANPQWKVWALTFNRTNWAFYLNGFVEGGGTCDLVAGFTGIEVGGEASQFYNGKTGNGTHAHVAIFGRALTAGEIGNLSDLLLSGILSSDAGPGLPIRKLNAAGWRGTRAFSGNGYFYTSEAAPSGSVFDNITEVMGYLDGDAFADSAGQIQGRSQSRTGRQAPRATLGDGPGELPFQPGIAYGFNPTYLFNDVEVNNVTINDLKQQSPGTTIVAIDDVSAARYGVRSLTRATRLASDYIAWHLAWWLLARYAYPQMRVGTVTVSATASNDTASSAGRWAFVAGVEVDDIVIVNWRPVGQPAISLRCRVLQVSPNFVNGTTTAAEVTLTLAAAPPRAPLVGDPTLGVLAGSALGI